jgi:hypothetical protein
VLYSAVPACDCPRYRIHVHNMHRCTSDLIISRSCHASLSPRAPQVYAIDLLGFGDSDKPLQQYTIETWAALVADFMTEFVGQAPAVLVGNSIGSLVCLTVREGARDFGRETRAAGERKGLQCSYCCCWMDGWMAVAKGRPVGWGGWAAEVQRQHTACAVHAAHQGPCL